MRRRWIAAVAVGGLWLAAVAGAQPGGAAGEAAPGAATDTSKLSVKLEMTQGGVAADVVQKDTPVEVVATVTINMPAVQRANVQVGLSIAEELSMDSEGDVQVKELRIDNGTGYALQPTTTIRPRLGFSADEGATGIVGKTQKVKWVVVFRNIAAKAPFNVSAAAIIPPSSDIIAEARDQIALSVRSALTVQQLWTDGGIFMWPLGFSLILGIAFAIERIWTVGFARIDSQAFFDKVAAALRDGGTDKAIEVCNKTRGPVAAVIREGLLRVHQGIDHVEKAIASAGAVEGSFLQRGMVVLASVTTIAPLIGFLGTVWGMVIAFKAIAEAGDVKPSIVANGISQALITTVTGLIIAITSQSFHNFITSRINRVIVDMEETSTMLVDLLIERGLDKPGSSQA